MRAARILLACAAVALAGPAAEARRDAPATPAPAVPAPGGPAPAPAPAPADGGAPVRLGGTELFRVRLGIGSLTPEERAKVLTERLEALVTEWGYTPGQLRLTEAPGVSEIRDGEKVLVAVTDADAAAVGSSRGDVARHVLERIDGAVRAERRLRTARDLPRHLLIAGGALLALLVLLRLLSLLLRFLGRRIGALLDRQLDDPRLQVSRILPRETIRRWHRLAGRGIAALVYFVPLYVYLLLLLALFPVALGWAGGLLDASWTALAQVRDGLVRFLPRLLTIALIGGVAWLVTRAARVVFEALADGRIVVGGFEREWAIPTYRLVRLLLVVLALIVCAPFMPGWDTGAFQGVSVFLGLLLSIGSGSAVANAVAGTTLTYTRAFRLGDRVKIGDTVGDVIEKTMLVTRVRTIKNVVVTLPNAAVLGSSVVNYSAAARGAGLILNTTVTIGYDAPWRTVHELLIAAARDTAGIVDDPMPFVLQTALSDFYVAYELNATTRDASLMAGLFSDLHRNIQERFAEAGVEIMSPHYNALRDGNAPALPPRAAAGAGEAAAPLPG